MCWLTEIVLSLPAHSGVDRRELIFKRLAAHRGRFLEVL